MENPSTSGQQVADKRLQVADKLIQVADKRLPASKTHAFHKKDIRVIQKPKVWTKHHPTNLCCLRNTFKINENM